MRLVSLVDCPSCNPGRASFFTVDSSSRVDLPGSGPFDRWRPDIDCLICNVCLGLNHVYTYCVISGCVFLCSTASLDATCFFFTTQSKCY